MVYVSKLEMRGFKSFGHKKEVIPLSPGLTAIIGPNGNGKSNIVDAISFVLGQMSAKTLRAEDFSGLIYHGSEGENGKRAAPYAKVKLHINDEKGELPVDSKKITVSRKVKKDGKSTYRLNGTVTTRQEILDLLSGELIGTEGYNFVMQGDVDKFIKMSSVDRRKIIDDLAGVAEFEEKKDRALTELNKVETNLKSEEGRLEEIEQNIKKLKKEKEEALKFQKLQEEFKVKQAALAQLEVDKYRKNLGKTRKKIRERDEKLEKHRKKVKEIKEKKNQLKEEKEKLTEVINEKRESEALKRVNRIKSKIETLKDNLKSTESDHKRLTKETKGLRGEIKKVAEKAEKESPFTKMEESFQEFQNLQKKFTKLTDEMEYLDEDPEKFKKSLPKVEDIIEKLASVISGLEENFKKIIKSRENFLETIEKNEKIEETGNIFEKLKSSLTSKNALLGDAKRRIKEFKGRINNSEDQLKEAEKEAEKIKDSISKTEEKIKNLGAKIDKTNQKQEKIEVKVRKNERKKNDLRTSEASTKTELKQSKKQLDKYGTEDFEIPDISRKKLKKQAREVKKELENLKPINEKAVKNYKKEKGRYSSQKEHYDKLEGEKQKLLDFMEEIDRKKSEVFMKTFEEISKNFSEVFSALSPEGEGRLILENPEDPLEGGLDIEAKPRGKKLVTIDSLSGGEKALTGLAFVFAIQQANPSALYVFDELDAHLDSENQKGVANLINRFAQESQIIVVTLKDPMMSAANKLFGVNMDDEKISHIVSVDLENFEVEN